MAGIDLRGKVAVVTGGYSGLGLETTRALAEAGAAVIVPARSPDKARRALAGIANVRQASLDLLDPPSIASFAQGVLSEGKPLDLPVNGAGIMATPFERDSRGYEMQFSANHLGHFASTLQLWPALRRSGSARVVAVSSAGHRLSGIDFDDPNFERRPYDKWRAYGQSKTANILFAVELDRRVEAHGVRTFAVHPGAILTGLARHLTDDEFAASGFARGAPAGTTPPGQSVEEGGRYKTVPQGASTILWCAVSKQLDGLGGVYCDNCDIGRPAAQDEGGAGVQPWAIDPVHSERLWEVSLQMTRLTFNP